MAEALATAVKRGVRVAVLVPGAIDHNIVRQASRGQFGRMLRAGIEIFEYRAGLLHAKTMVIDGVWSTIGSTNLDNRSFALNDELNVVIYNVVVAQRLERIFTEDLGYSERVDYREWRRRGLVDRVLELLARPIRDQL
jgi:cardiolipin synthase